MWPLGYTASSLCIRRIWGKRLAQLQQMCVCLPPPYAHELILAFSPHSQWPTLQWAGWGVGGLISVCPRKSGKAWQTGKIVESNIKTWCAVSHAVKHLLVRRKQTHTRTAQTRRLTHLASQEAMGPVGQSKLESLVHLFTSNYRNRTISATTASAFFYFTSLRVNQRKKKRERQSFDRLFPSGERLVISSPQRCWEMGRGGGGVIVL